MLRKALRKINWIAGMPRPEISYHVYKISARVKNANVHTINKVIKYITNTPPHITVPELQILECNYTLMRTSITCRMAKVKEDMFRTNSILIAWGSQD